MDIDQYLKHVGEGKRIQGGSEMHSFMHEMAYEAMRVTCEINNSYHNPESIRALFSELIGKEVPGSFALFPPFTSDFGKNITVGENVFINSGCRFQDQGGITIGDGSLIGHNVILATLNHGLLPEDRHSLYPAPIFIEKNVWIGAGATVLPGITIADNAVIAAGAVVTKNVAENCIAGGVPAKTLKTIGDGEEQ